MGHEFRSAQFGTTSQRAAKTGPFEGQGLTLVSQMPSAIKTIPAKKRSPCVSSNTNTPANGTKTKTSAMAWQTIITKFL